MAATAAAVKRLMQEWRTWEFITDDILTLEPVSDENVFEWRALVRGPDDTPFAGGVFGLRIEVPDSYPLKPPSIRFQTPICHPNIHFKTGEICLNVLKTEWTPAWTLQGALQAILLLLAHPEPDSPLNCDAANLLRCGDLLAYRSLVKYYTRLYARID